MYGILLILLKKNFFTDFWYVLQRDLIFIFYLYKSKSMTRTKDIKNKFVT